MGYLAIGYLVRYLATVFDKLWVLNRGVVLDTYVGIYISIQGCFWSKKQGEEAPTAMVNKASPTYPPSDDWCLFYKAFSRM